MPFFDGMFEESQFRAAWDAVEIVRGVSYSLFTFGESELPYYLVLSPRKPDELVKVRKGMIRITRPLIITPDNATPEFRDFFEDAEETSAISFLMSRTASFAHLRLQNQSGSEQLVSDSSQEIVEKLNRQLDHEEEDRVAIMTAPQRFAGVALLRYASDRIAQSAPSNIQELRERGFLR